MKSHVLKILPLTPVEIKLNFITEKNYQIIFLLNVVYRSVKFK